MPLSDAAKALFPWDDNSKHAPKVAEPEGNGFRCACRCGYPGKLVTSSPSHAYNATKVHAVNENRREGDGGPAVAPEDYTNAGDPPKSARRAAASTGGAPSRPTTGARRASQGTPGTPCGCGCGEPSGGLFRPGHDSKLLSQLLKAIREDGMTLEQAHAKMTEIGTSEVLREKLAKKVG
ncbi:hypothetical protein SEA_KEANU_38 [Streptomyces phage Keanu]|nr:hypothetical protein SEA_KEANU_38 [Streptomyces phage Keanu]